LSVTAVVDNVTGQKRAYALDALRGIAILMMVLSSVEPMSIVNHLPSFMYHGQVPPPEFVFNPNLPGVTWVDMVFPFFLFSMGAAIPLAMSRRIEQGVPWHKLVGSTLLRGLILSLFAIYVEHIRTGCIDPVYTAGMVGKSIEIFLIGTGGFLLLFPILGRMPTKWKASTRIVVKTAGWLAAIALMFIVRYDPKISTAHSATFSLDKFDIIIMILANVAVYTTFAYMLTRKNILLRLGILGCIMAMRLSAGAPDSWVGTLQANFPIPWMDQLNFLGPIGVSILKTVNNFFNMGCMSYLFIAIPGTIVGDRILSWINASETSIEDKQEWTPKRYIALAGLLFGTVILTIIMLKGRHVWQLVLCLIPLLYLGNRLVKNASNSVEILLHDLYKWGVYLLAVGMIFEPYENGIKKDSATMSYYFVSAGLAIFMLSVFSIIIDVFKRKKILQLLIDNGQNPMIAYTAGGNLIGTTLAVLGIDAYAGRTITTPWPYFTFSLLFTLLVALVVSFCTKKKWFWRT